MLRVGHICGIIMRAGVREINSGAAAAFMNMKSEEAAVGLGKTFDIYRYEDMIFSLVKDYLTAQLRRLGSSSDMGDGVRTGGDSLHRITSF